MKYLLSFTLVLLFCFSASAQRAFKVRADLQTSNLKNTKFYGLSLGLKHKSNWLLQYDLESSGQEAYNLPNNFSGPNDLNDRYLFHSISLGRLFSVNQNKKVRFSTKIGLHMGRYRGYDNFIKNPPLDDLSVADALSSPFGILLLPVALLDHQNYSTHSYSRVSEKLMGLNGELLLDYQFNKYIILSVGAKLMVNKRIKNIGPNFKIGFQF